MDCLKWIMLGLALLLAGCSARDDGFLSEGEIIDLTYPFNEQTIFWPTAEGFQLEKGSEGVTPNGYFYSANTLSMAEHGGTHIDAPYHFWAEGNTVDEIPSEQLMGKGIVVDVSDSALSNADYQITKADLENWEGQHGRIPEGAIVLLYTGYGRFWPDRVKYMGTDEKGAQAVAKLHFPGLHPNAADWLASERSIKLVGIDTPSIDYGQSTHFESHVTLFSHNIPALENVANLERLPASGSKVIALPLKIESGSGAPVRIFALTEQKEQE